MLILNQQMNNCPCGDTLDAWGVCGKCAQAREASDKSKISKNAQARQ